jgi:hypothetical protein
MLPAGPRRAGIFTRGTYRWLLEPLLAAAGFEIVTVDFRLRAFGAYTCVKR